MGRIELRQPDWRPRPDADREGSENADQEQQNIDIFVLRPEVNDGRQHQTHKIEQHGRRFAADRVSKKTEANIADDAGRRADETGKARPIGRRQPGFGCDRTDIGRDKGADPPIGEGHRQHHQE